MNTTPKIAVAKQNDAQVVGSNLINEAVPQPQNFTSSMNDFAEFLPAGDDEKVNAFLNYSGVQNEMGLSTGGADVFFSEKKGYSSSNQDETTELIDRIFKKISESDSVKDFFDRDIPDFFNTEVPQLINDAVKSIKEAFEDSTSESFGDLVSSVNKIIGGTLIGLGAIATVESLAPPVAQELKRMGESLSGGSTDGEDTENPPPDSTTSDSSGSSDVASDTPSNYTNPKQMYDSGESFTPNTDGASLTPPPQPEATGSGDVPTNQATATNTPTNPNTPVEPPAESTVGESNDAQISSLPDSKTNNVAEKISSNISNYEHPNTQVARLLDGTEKNDRASTLAKVSGTTTNDQMVAASDQYPDDISNASAANVGPLQTPSKNNIASVVANDPYGELTFNERAFTDRYNKVAQRIFPTVGSQTTEQHREVLGPEQSFALDNVVRPEEHGDMLDGKKIQATTEKILADNGTESFNGPNNDNPQVVTLNNNTQQQQNTPNFIRRSVDSVPDVSFDMSSFSEHLFFNREPRTSRGLV